MLEERGAGTDGAGEGWGTEEQARPACYRFACPADRNPPPAPPCPPRNRHGARLNVVPEIVAKGLRAGQPVEMAGAAPPVGFKTDRKLAPVAEFAAARDLRIDRVRIGVWSGMRPSSLLETFMAWIPLFFGLTFLALFLWWRRR